MAISAQLGMTVRRVDAITAYLNSYLDKPVYMEIPESLTMILKEILQKNGKNGVGN